MINLFTIPETDQSIVYLGHIFGVVGNIYKVKDAPLIFGIMFKTFNAVALSLGALVVVYTTIVGLLATAHEGEFFGKKWSGLWVPLRTLLGIAALFPTGTGYSALQILMMWFIVQGVGAADTLWTSVINYSQVQGSVTGTVSIPTPDAEMRTLLKGLICQAEGKWGGGSDRISPTNYFCQSAGKGSDFCNEANLLDVTKPNSWQVKRQDGLITYYMGPSGACGTLIYGDPDVACATTDKTKDTIIQKVKCAAYKKQQEALKGTVQTLGALAEVVARSDFEYWSFYQGAKASDWIAEYCSAKGVTSPQACCVDNAPANLSPLERLERGYPLESPCTKDKRSIFKLPFAKDGEVPNYKNTSGEAISEIYMPYTIEKNILQGADPLSVADNAYIELISKAITSEIQASKGDKITDEWRKNAVQNGWALAGTYYFKMSAETGNFLTSAIPPLTVKSADLESALLSRFRNNYSAADKILSSIDDASKENKGGVSSGLPGQLGAVSRSLDSTAEQITARFMHHLTGGDTGKSQGGAFNQWAEHPLSEIAGLGRSFMIIAQAFFAAFIGGAFILAWATGVKVWALGTGVDPGIGQAVLVFILIILPAIFSFLLGLFTFGATLAIYVPLIPYILFVMGVLGWLISCIEAMVAAPMIAIGILSPGGQHEVLGRAEPALMLLLGVFLRPSLMIFGLIGAMLLSIVGVTIVNVSFAAVMGDINANPGAFEIFIFLAAYCFLIVSVINKCCTLIHLIPERVMTWIGGQAVSYGEGEALGEVKRGTEQAASAAGGLAAAAAGKAWGGKMKAKKEKKAGIGE